MREINKIIVHWSASGKNTTRRDIYNWHVNRKPPFANIGYHRIILYPFYNETGWESLVEQGRPDNVIGAHCKNHNTGSLGVCVIGNKDYSIHNLQITALEKTVNNLCKQYNIKPLEVYGHNEMSGQETNECPGKTILSLVEQIRDVQEILARDNK